MPAGGRRSMLSLPASRYGKAIARRPARSLAPLARPAWPLRLFFSSRSATTASPSIRWFFRAGWKEAGSRASTKPSAHGFTVTPKSLTNHAPASAVALVDLKKPIVELAPGQLLDGFQELRRAVAATGAGAPLACVVLAI